MELYCKAYMPNGDATVDTIEKSKKKGDIREEDDMTTEQRAEMVEMQASVHLNMSVVHHL